MVGISSYNQIIEEDRIQSSGQGLSHTLACRITHEPLSSCQYDLAVRMRVILKGLRMTSHVWGEGQLFPLFFRQISAKNVQSNG